MDSLWTLPNSLSIKWSECSSKGEYTIYSLTFIPVLTRFGPFRVGFINRERRSLIDSLSQVEKETSLSHTEDRFGSNWLRYVKCTSQKEEGNLIAVQTTSGFYYVAMKPITANEELIVWYPNTIHREKEGYPGATLGNFEVTTLKELPHRATGNTDINPCTSRQNREIRLLYERGLEFEDTLAQKSLQLEDDQFISNKNTIFYSKNKSTDMEIKKTTTIINANLPNSTNNVGSSHTETSFQSDRSTKENKMTNTSQEYPSTINEVVHNTSLGQENLNPIFSKRIKLPTESGVCRKTKNLWSVREMHAHILSTKKDSEDSSYVQTGGKSYEQKMEGRNFTVNSNSKEQKAMHVEGRYHESNTSIESTNQSNSLEYYEGVHIGEMRYKSKTFGGAFNLMPNRLGHNSRKISYMSNIGREEFIQKRMLIPYERPHTGEKANECKAFSKKFSSNIGMKAHNNLKTHNVVNTGEKPYECKTCSRKFSQIGHLKAHIRIHTGEKPYDCKTCKRKFSELRNLKRHNIIHAVEKPCECKNCDRKFSDLYSLKRHETTHTGEKPYECKTCCRKFSRKSYLKAHNRIHTGEKPYECKTCNRKFSDLYSLKTHERTHTGEKPYECKTCNRKFSQIRYLKAHNRIHTGEKPYECKTCSRKFSRKSSLKEHNLIHTGEKPYECKTCNRNFSHLSSLKTHYRTHTGERPYECKTCKRKFSGLSNLKRHNIIHAVEKPYECKTCSRNERECFSHVINLLLGKTE